MQKPEEENIMQFVDKIDALVKCIQYRICVNVGRCPVLKSVSALEWGFLEELAMLLFFLSH